MPAPQSYADAPLTPDQVKAVGYTDAPLTDAHPWLTKAKEILDKAFPPEQPRADSNIATVGGVGIAPEDLLLAGQATRNVGAAVRLGAGATGKLTAAAKAVAAHATPVVKYELVRSGLEHLHVPAPIAIPIAMAVSGYSKGVKAGAGAAEAERGVVAEAPAMPTLVKGASVPTAPGPAVSAPAAKAVEAAQQAQAAAGTAAPKLTLNAAESQEYLRLLKRGLSGAEARQAVLVMRDLAARLGGASAEDVAKAVAHREGTGRW